MTSPPGAPSGGSSTPPPPPPPPPPAPAPEEAGTGAFPAPGEETASSPGADEAAGPTSLPPYGKPVPTQWGWYARLPLRARLVAIIALLLAAGLGIAALATTTVVSNYLVGQVDEQLQNTSEDVAENPDQQFSNSSALPSDYYILKRLPGSRGTQYITPETFRRFGYPDIPAMSNPEVEKIVGKPFTVATTTDGPTVPSDPTEWRVMPLLQIDNSTKEVIGTAFVALPLTGIHDTVRILGLTLALTALAIALIGGAVAYLAVHRALRPLREIETTAAGIATGDLSRRVRPAPPTTEVGSLASSLNAMLSQIEQAFSAREASEARMRRFISDASHELRTPLATVRGYGELYRMGALTTSDQMDDTMRRIEDSATRMGTLVNDLLALARLDEGRPIRKEPVDLVPLARDSAGDLHALDPTRGVQVIGLRGGEPPASLEVVGDEDRLRQVLANLIGNVSQHTPAGSPVQIALDEVSGPDGDAVVLEVRDHGTGITDEQADRIFERFYRADSSRNRSSGGSGLGMAIVAAIVGAHQGSVSVAPTQGGGLTVRVKFPARRYDDGSSAVQSSARPA